MSRPEANRRSAALPWTAAGLIAVVLAASACGAFGRQPGAPDPVSDGGEQPRDFAVQVTNNSWSAIHVYVVAGGQWESLGLVASQNTADYEVSRSRLGGRGEIRLVADPVGSTQGYFSDPILVEPGDRVEWTLQNNLSLSSVFVR